MAIVRVRNSKDLFLSEAVKGRFIVARVADNIELRREDSVRYKSSLVGLRMSLRSSSMRTTRTGDQMQGIHRSHFAHN